MKKSNIDPMPQFFDRYIHLAEDADILDALEASQQELKQRDREMLKAIGDIVYAPGKWTIKDIVQHIIDNERIQAYRALRFARNDTTALPGYDENTFAANTTTADRSLDDLFQELLVVRESTLWLFRSFSDDMLLRTGVCNNKSISVLALGFVIVGHQIHHFDIIDERYMPFIKA